MKLFNFELTTLKSKLYAIVFASFVVRVVAFFALPNTPNAFGPDEGTYGRAANWVSLSKPVTDFPEYGAGLYVSGRSLLLPAAFLNKIGLTPLDSVRLTASLYGLLTLCLVTALILHTVSRNTNFAQFAAGFPGLLITLFLTFTFLPSHLIWSLLGLRESAIEFWTLCVFASLYWLFHFHKKISLKSSILLVASIVFAFSSRAQVGWVIVIAILIFLLINIRERIALTLIPLVLVGLVLGFTGTTGTITSVGEKIIGSLAIAGEIASYKHQVNQLAAQSAITTQSCPRDGLAYTNRPSSRLDTYFCIAWRAPYMAATFLFRPLIFIDTTSTSSLFAAIENIAWLGAFIFIVVMLIKKRRLAFIGPLAPSLIFFMLYCVGAGSYEGNMGTAFRHKSLILWVILLLLASVMAAEKRPKPRNESAQKGV